MPRKKINIKRHVSQNPRIDRKQLREVAKLLKELKESDIVESAEYNLSSPFSRDHSQPREDLAEDPRSLHLRF